AQVGELVGDDGRPHRDVPFDEPHGGGAEAAVAVVDEDRPLLRRDVALHGSAFVHDSGQASASIWRVSRRSCGSTLVCPTTGMKLVSPPHRGTTCWCRWAAIPAPATGPWLSPMLNPWAPLVRRMTRMAI